MKSISIISASFSAFMKNPAGFVLYLVLYGVCSIVAFGAAMGATFLVTYLGVIDKALEGQVTFMVATLAIFAVIWLVFLLMVAGLKAAFFRALYEAGRGGGMGLIQFLEYTAHKALPVFGIELGLLVLFAVFMAPAGLSMVFVKSDIATYGLAALGALAFSIVSLFFWFAVPAIVLDNESSIGSVVRSAKTVLSNPVDFVVLVIALFVINAASLITIVGPFLVMPQVIAYSTMLFYSQMKKS
jgi:hypothetical protein